MSNRLNALALAGALALLSACANQSPTLPGGLTRCTEPRPEICTMQWAPVCGYREDGSAKTYATGCNACADPAVVGHLPDECP